MFRAMAMKELREVRGIGLLALAANVYLVAAATNPRVFPPVQRASVPLVNDDFFFSFFVVISAATAIALGLRQTWGESLRGTYPFLFHRPAERRWLVGVKLLIGVAVCLVSSAVSILGYAFWAATPGTHASPFEWSMTALAWQLWLSVTPLYLGAFLAGIRRGRWYVRIFPLAAGGVFGGFAVAAGDCSVTAVAILTTFAAALTGGLWLTAAVLFTARTRDYP